MAAPIASEDPPSLLGITVRRSIYNGRGFLIYGMGVSLLLAVILNLVPGSAFPSAYPLILPIFGVVGSMGGLMVFTSDRMKGVLEYLMAYGISPRRLFVNILLAGLALVTIVLAVALGVGVGLYLAEGHALSADLAEAIGLYAVPMSYASAAFAATVGMFWSALSSPREGGMSSPVGLAPLIGILPSLGTLGLVGTLAAAEATTATLDLVAVAVVVVVVVVVVLLVSMVGRLLARERLLSPV